MEGTTLIIGGKEIIHENTFKQIILLHIRWSQTKHEGKRWYHRFYECFDVFLLVVFECVCNPSYYQGNDANPNTFVLAIDNCIPCNKQYLFSKREKIPPNNSDV